MEHFYASKKQSKDMTTGNSFGYLFFFFFFLQYLFTGIILVSDHLFCRLDFFPSLNLLSYYISPLLWNQLFGVFFSITEQKWSYFGDSFIMVHCDQAGRGGIFYESSAANKLFDHELDTRMIAVLTQSQATLVSNLTMATTGDPPYYLSLPPLSISTNTCMHSHLPSHR